MYSYGAAEVAIGADDALWRASAKAGAAAVKVRVLFLRDLRPTVLISAIQMSAGDSLAVRPLCVRSHADGRGGKQAAPFALASRACRRDPHCRPAAQSPPPLSASDRRRIGHWRQAAGLPHPPGAQLSVSVRYSAKRYTKKTPPKKKLCPYAHMPLCPL